MALRNASREPLLARSAIKLYVCNAESFSATARLTNWLMETPSWTAADLSVLCSESGILRLSVLIILLKTRKVLIRLSGRWGHGRFFAWVMAWLNLVGMIGVCWRRRFSGCGIVKLEALEIDQAFERRQVGHVCALNVELFQIGHSFERGQVRHFGV